MAQIEYPQHDSSVCWFLAKDLAKNNPQIKQNLPSRLQCSGLVFLEISNYKQIDRHATALVYRLKYRPKKVYMIYTDMMPITYVLV